MRRMKKLTYSLLVVAMLVGLGLPARANCLISITSDAGYEGFISCGSSAGNYIAGADGNTHSFPFVDLICLLAC